MDAIKAERLSFAGRQSQGCSEAQMWSVTTLAGAQPGPYRSFFLNMFLSLDCRPSLWKYFSLQQDYCCGNEQKVRMPNAVRLPANGQHADDCEACTGIVLFLLNRFSAIYILADCFVDNW